MSTSRDIPVIDEEFAASLISALSKSASSFMIASHFVSLTENLLMRTMQMSLSYRPLAIALLLQLFQVAGKSITDARKGRLRLQIAKLAIECKLCDVACDCDPREQLQEAAKYAKKCIRDANDSTLWNEVCAVAQTHGIHATWLDC